MDKASAGKGVFAASRTLVGEILTFEHFDSHKKSWDDFSNQDCVTVWVVLLPVLISQVVCLLKLLKEIYTFTALPHW